MRKLIDLNDWNRKEHFEFFNTFEEPFFGVTLAIDCTFALQKSKDLGISFFIYYLHKTLAAINTQENFKYRIHEKQVYEYDTIDASATIMREDKTFGFSLIPYHEDLNIFNQNALQEIKRIQETKGLFTREFPNNLIHFSALPWINFTGITHSRNYKFEDSCPKISMGKVYHQDGKKYMNMAIFVHHGLIDGYHLGLFTEKFQDLMNN